MDQENEGCESDKPTTIERKEQRASGWESQQYCIGNGCFPSLFKHNYVAGPCFVHVAEALVEDATDACIMGGFNSQLTKPIQTIAE